MTDMLDMDQMRQDAPVQTTSVADDSAWYLYGITLRGDADQPSPQDGCDDRREPELAAAPWIDAFDSLRRLACGDLEAIVRPVSRAEFQPDALQSRLRDAAWLEAMVRSHNQVIASIHQQQAILPAKFGSVYARVEDLSAALEEAHDSLVAQLRYVEGCDEWGIHLYADRPVVQRHVAAENSTMQRLQQEIAAARPGRAYFLQRKLADELAAATEQRLDDLARMAYDHLVRWSVAGRVNPPVPPSGEVSDEIGILRADFLVRREDQDTFLTEVRTFVEAQEGLRCEYSGPWPPYSFAMLTERNG